MKAWQHHRLQGVLMRDACDKDRARSADGAFSEDLDEATARCPIH